MSSQTAVPDDNTAALDFLHLAVAPRTEGKPREKGLTMVMDQGWPIEFVDGMLDAFGSYLDVVKLWDPLLLSSVRHVRRRVEAYLKHDVLVQPGGLFLEVAEQQDKTGEVLKRLRDFGFDCVEVSSTTSTRGTLDEHSELVRAAVDLGYRVVGEVGRKFADGDETRLAEHVIDIDVTVGEFTRLLEAGAWKVYWEGHLLRMVMGDDPDGIRAQAGTGTQQVLEVARQVGQDNIMFEVSGLRPKQNRQWLQFWLVRTFGPDVNIANARIEEMANLEAIRRGNHPIFGFGNAGNYPWMRTGSSVERWWRA
ncbi:phosphosulfolactate synthase [Actinophytocola sp.]|uniref:phosphosulfolactate synthase n=1 Tax=Actinophytocola sp. TaxID=1872138 RepID=UPI003D6B9E56